MAGIRRLDEVSIFDGKLCFLIPHEWVEGDDEGTDSYLYHAPGTKSGWLRASLITVSVDSSPALKLQEMFKGASNLRVDAETGKYVSSWEKDSTEEGTPTHIYYWKVGNIAGDKQIREAIFSYTVLRECVEDADNRNVVDLLSQILCRAKFGPQIELRS